MPAEINYKKKYLELRAKYIADIDVAFRAGFEQGAQNAQQQQAIEAEANAQQMQMQQQAIQAGGMGGEGGAEKPPGGEGGPEVGKMPGKANENPAQEGQPVNGSSGNSSEIDSHINKLQGMIGKGHAPEIQKAVRELADLRKREQAAMAINGIAKALHKPAHKMGVQAKQNMSDTAKKSLSLQHKIVADVMEKWEKESQKAGSDIKNILNIEGVLGE